MRSREHGRTGLDQEARRRSWSSRRASWPGTAAGASSRTSWKRAAASGPVI